MTEEKKYPDDMLSANDAGKILGVSGKTVLRLRESGAIPGYRISDLWKFKRGEVEAYRDAQRQPPQIRREPPNNDLPIAA